MATAAVERRAQAERRGGVLLAAAARRSDGLPAADGEGAREPARLHHHQGAPHRRAHVPGNAEPLVCDFDALRRRSDGEPVGRRLRLGRHHPAGRGCVLLRALREVRALAATGGPCSPGT